MKKRKKKKKYKLLNLYIRFYYSHCSTKKTYSTKYYLAKRVKHNIDPVWFMHKKVNVYKEKMAVHMISCLTMFYGVFISQNMYDSTHIRQFIDSYTCNWLCKSYFNRKDRSMLLTYESVTIQAIIIIPFIVKVSVNIHAMLPSVLIVGFYYCSGMPIRYRYSCFTRCPYP